MLVKSAVKYPLNNPACTPLAILGLNWLVAKLDLQQMQLERTCNVQET